MNTATIRDPETIWDPTAAVLVDSRRSEYRLVQSTVLPAFQHWGIAYRLIDLATTTDIAKALGNSGLAVIAQEYLGEMLAGRALDTLIARLSRGAAVINLDHTLFQYPNAYQELIGITGHAEEIDIDSLVIPNVTHPVLQGRPRGTGPRLRMPLPAFRAAGLGLGGEVLLGSGSGEPLLVTHDIGTGRLVQWLVSPKIWNRGYLGLAHGLDSLLWRAIAWAAPKPFVMNALPPYVRYRFDDCNGHWQNPSDLGFVDELNRMGHIPSICFCFKALTPEGIAHVAKLQQAGKIDLAPHTFAPSRSFFYGDSEGEYSTEQLRSMFAELDQAKQDWGVKWSTILSDHEHETSPNAIPFIRERGIRHKMNILLPGERWTDPHIDWHPAPYGSMSYALDYLPGELSDFFAVFNHHPSFDSARVYATDDNTNFTYHRPGGYGRQKWDFLNGLVTGPEPESKRLDAAADRLAEHTHIGLDAQFFGGSISHSHFTRHLAAGEMTRIVEQADAQLEGLEQIPASYDEIADYAEAKANTVVTAARNVNGAIEVELTGRTWRDLRLSVYTELDRELVRSETPLPAFAGTTTVAVAQSALT